MPAYICTKPPRSCKTCGHYRFDPDRMDYACWVQYDKKQEMKNNRKKRR